MGRLVPAPHVLLAEAPQPRRGRPRRQACAAGVNLAASAAMTTTEAVRSHQNLL